MSSLDKVFTATLEKSPKKGGWTYVVTDWSAEFFGTRGLVKVVAEVDGIPYLDYMATGGAAIAVLFTALTPALMNGFFRRTGSHL